MAKIETLVEDINKVLDTGKEPDIHHLSSLLKDVKEAINKQLLPSNRDRGSYLRMSNIGKGDRQVWYEVNGNPTAEELTPDTRLKFLYGDIIEAILIYLAKEAGHDVQDEQDQVSIEGIKGHIDCKIDGALVDVKSASSYGFKKFNDGSLYDNDSFGYIPQVSAYAHCKGTEEAGFLVMEKSLGKLAYMSVPKEKRIDPVARIKHMKDVVASDTPPERCYEPLADGKSGNMKLNVNCSYCPHKDTCWSDANDGEGLRKFIYSTGPRWLTTVERVPDVHEVTDGN